MRIVIKLRSIEGSLFETQYHHHLQAFIYDLLRDSKYDFMHSKQGYKFFCFSNIFPITKNLEKNDLRNLIISSPNNDLISFLNEKLHGNNKQIRIGKMKFKVDSCRKINVVIPTGQQYSLITGTPIIVRIRRDKYDNYQKPIEQINRSKNYEYVYWRTDHPIDLFITQLEDNLIKKYNLYFGSNIRRQPIFIKFLPPLKQISTRIDMNHNQIIVIGTTWDFIFEEASPLIQFALDTGLGELNALGFGFMNLKYAGDRST
jgi:CRISPR-associated endoribonuclease Cas6